MQRTSAHGEIEGVEVGDPVAAPRLRFHQLIAQTVRQPIYHFILQLEQVRDILLKPIRPNMRARLRVDQLRVDAHAALVALHRAFQHIPNPEFPPDLPCVDGLALERERRIARDDKAFAYARKIGRQILGDAISEIVLRGIA
jgi:hypothetical protein